MSSTRPVLIGIELDAPSQIVLAGGWMLAERLGAPANVVHVDTSAHPQEKETVLAALRSFVHPLGDSAELRVLHGDAGERLVEAARECSAKLVVVGARDRRRTERRPLGPTTRYAVRKAPCAALAIDVSRPWEIPARVVYATDLPREPTPADLWAARLASAFGAPLDVVHVDDLPGDFPPPYSHPAEELARLRMQLSRRMDELTERLRASMSGVARVEGRIISGAEPAEIVCHFAAEREADVLVVGTRRRGTIARATLGSVAEEVIRSAPTSVLVVPPEDDHEPGRRP
jgi:nucleotide-binding universal stress UspA family protein